MRRLLLLPLLAFSVAACASETLRVGQQVLMVGDTAAHTLDLLGTPVYKEPVENKFGAFLGERWQFSREDGHVIIVTIIAGKVSAIEDHLEERRG
jgi:hydrogenase maturation factor